MKLIIQVILIVVVIGIVGVALGRRRTHSGKAWKKIGLLFIAIAMIVAILFPQTTNYLANFVGVGRGADLLLYVTVVAFIFYILNNYLHQQDQRDMIFRLARKIALLEAKENKKNKDIVK